jgi:hypothetical protein
MEFENRTPLPARALTGSTGDRETVGIVVCKVTFRVAAGRLERVDGEDAWPIFEQPFLFRGRSFQPELDFRKRGVDLLVFSEATAPEGRPVTYLRSGVVCGDRAVWLEVLGDRVWEPERNRLVPSPPQPFLTMPLTNDRAYGGVASYAGEELPHPVNPDGRGFVMDPEAGAGTPLPNLERPGQLLTGWTDRPEPVSLTRPLGLPASFMAALGSMDAGARARAMLDVMFQEAVPEFVFPEGALPDRVRLLAASPAGDVELPLPPNTGPPVTVRIGRRAAHFPTRLSTVVVLGPERVVVATYRALFRYLVQPEELRAAVLGARPAARVVSVHA